MNKVKANCPNCGQTVTQESQRSMRRCVCGVKWCFTLEDGQPRLYQNGRHTLPADQRKRPVAFSWSKAQDARAAEAGYTRQQLLDYGYRTLVEDK